MADQSSCVVLLLSDVCLVVASQIAHYPTWSPRSLPLYLPGAPTINLTVPMYVITPDPLNVSCHVASFPQSVVTVVVGQTQKMVSPEVSFDSTTSVVVHKTGDVEFTVDEYGSNNAVVTCMAAVDTEMRSSLPATVQIYGEEVHKSVG